ncbi:MAG: non-ribosomal peptide synthetase, partial [Acidobacteria bacterium]
MSKASTPQMFSALPLRTTADPYNAGFWPREKGEQDLLVPQLIASQAASAPEATAVVEGDRVLTYGELNRRADQLSRQLRLLGVGPEIIVGFCLERRMAMVIAALGILKAGAAYLPIDPGCPYARQEFLLKDAQVAVLVGGTSRTGLLPTGSWHLVTIDPAGQPAGFPERSVHSESPAIVAQPENLAYVIYTSGSTGKPKGVEITHRSLLNLVTWHQCAFGVTASDRATQLASVAFDAAVWEIWAHLTAGASVHIPNERSRGSPELLREWLVAHGITITFVPTALAERLIRLPWPRETALRVMLTGADTLHVYPSADLPF